MNFTRSQQVRIVIADDHPIFRDGLRRLLEAEAELNVAGEAADGAQAVKLGRQLKPDILLLDLAMPKQTGLEALRELSVPANSSLVRVILLTAAIEKVQILQALQLGARGIVLKESATQMLFEAIERVMAGEYWVHRERVSNLVEYLRTLMQSTHDDEHLGTTPDRRSTETDHPFSFWPHLRFFVDYRRSAPAANARGHQQRCRTAQGFPITQQNE